MNVQLPNGQIASFPDSMSPEEINSAIGAQFPQGQGTSAQPATPTQADSLATAVTAKPSAPAGSWAPHWLQVPINQLWQGLAAGSDFMASPLMRANTRLPALTAGDPRSVGPGLGSPSAIMAPLTPFAGVQPQNAPERYLGAVARGVGTAVPTLGLGGGVLPTLAAGGSGAVASEALNDLAPGSPDWAHAAVAAAPALFGAGAMTALGRGELGEVAGSLGSSKTLQEAGEHLQAGARQWLERDLPAQEERVWGALDEALDPDGFGAPQVGMSNTEAVLKNIVKEDALDPRQTKLATVTAPGPAKQILSALRGEPQPEPSFLPPPRVGGNKPPPSKTVLPSGQKIITTEPEPAQPGPAGGGLRAINTPGATPGPIAPVDWGFARDLRSTIGDAMSDSSSPLFKSLGQKKLSGLYAAVTKDLGEAATSAGAGAQFDLANATSSALRSLAEDHIKPLLDVSPGVAVSRAMAGSARDGTRLAALRSVAPEAVDELVSAHLLQTPKAWAKMSPEARAALVPDPALRVRISGAVARATGQPGELTGLGHDLIGGSAGGALGVLASELLGTSELGTGAAGELLGLGLRPAARGLAAVAQNPSLVRLPMVGALAGNELGGR